MTLYDKNGNLSNILFNSYFLYGVTITHEDETPLLFQELDREVGQFKLPCSRTSHHDVATFWVALTGKDVVPGSCGSGTLTISIYIDTEDGASLHL